MLLTLLASLIFHQFFDPYFANFERQAELAGVLLKNSPTAEAPIRVNAANLGPKTSSESALALDQQSRAILWSRNAQTPRPIASLTKLMSALIFLEQVTDLSQTFTLTAQDMAGAGVQYLDKGETVRLPDLLFASLIASDNNAAESLVRASNLSYDEFVARMNFKAREIGMLNTRFIEPTGLQYANISSAQDVALLLEEALENELIADIVGRQSYTLTAVSGQTHRLVSTNKLLGSYLDVFGGKTGFIDEAEYNLAAAVRGDEGQVLLLVSLGSENADARFHDVKAMADWSFRNYVWR